MPERSLVCPPELAGERLDRALVALGVARSRSEAQRLIDAGCVHVAGRPADRARRLVGGDVVSVAALESQPARDEAELPPVRVVYADTHLLVVDKPAGVAVHGAPGVKPPTLDRFLRERGAAGGDPQRPGIVHRLDRDTSGLLVVARSDAAYEELVRALRARRIERVYLALVAGDPAASEGLIEAPLGRDRRRRTRRTVAGAGARPALTRFRVRERHARTALLEVALVTGRTHQIRAHLEAIGHPVVGDPVYGGRTLGVRLGLERQFLHAARLRFDHPASGATLEFESQLPTDLADALARARELS